MYKISNKMISNIELKTTIEEFINNIENDRKNIHIYNVNNEEINDYSKYIGTSMELKLEIDGQVQDYLEVVVLGDIDGDGKCMSSDYRLINKHKLGQNILTDCKFIAGDVNKDNVINEEDYELVNNYIMKKTNSFINT